LICCTEKLEISPNFSSTATQSQARPKAAKKIHSGGFPMILPLTMGGEIPVLCMRRTFLHFSYILLSSPNAVDSGSGLVFFDDVQSPAGVTYLRPVALHRYARLSLYSIDLSCPCMKTEVR
jgi:hypothetical protein